MPPRLPLLAALAASCAAAGCVKKDYPDAPVVEHVTVQNARVVDPDEVLPGLATADSPQFLGIWDGVVFDYEVFDETLLERDLERIERYYRARGYYEAKVTAARVWATDAHHVQVEIRVHEGSPVRIAGDVTLRGIEQLPFDAALAAEHARTLKRGDRFDEADYARNKRDIVRALADAGYAFVRVEGTVVVDIARHSAQVDFRVVPGRRAIYGEVHIAGLHELPEGPVRENLDVEQGRRYSAAELDDARTALINLGVFATVDVRQDLSHPESGTVPITVVVEEAPLRTLRIGGGMRFDVLEWSSHMTFGWEHRNFLGGLRKLTLETKPGVVFYPTRTSNFVAPTHVLPKNRVRVELRQPSFIEGRTTGFVVGEFNVYPVLYPELGTDPTANENVIGYAEVRADVGVERHFWGHHVYVSPSFNWQANVPFAYVNENELETVFVSYPELRTELDLRNDPIDPRSGLFLANTLQVAGHRIFGGDASDVKVQPEVRTYVPISKTVTFATRATVGFLFPANYGDSLDNPADAVLTDQQRQQELRDQQLLLLRAFYSGGPNSNRGYAFRGVGPHGPIRFLLPSNANCRTEDPECYRPLGGLTLWEASLETRFPLFGPLRGALFVDASDVNTEVARFRFDFPHLSPGLGLRYATPVGPIRIDVGYRVPYAQQIGEKSLPKEEGNPGTILGAPISVGFGLGEAY